MLSFRLWQRKLGTGNCYQRSIREDLSGEYHFIICSKICITLFQRIVQIYKNHTESTIKVKNIPGDLKPTVVWPSDIQWNSSGLTLLCLFIREAEIVWYFHESAGIKIRSGQTASEDFVIWSLKPQDEVVSRLILLCIYLNFSPNPVLQPPLKISLVLTLNLNLSIAMLRFVTFRFFNKVLP